MRTTPPTVFVHEFVTGGGMAGTTLPQGMAAEGGAMLKRALQEFADWGEYRTVTLLDERLSDMSHAADETLLADQHNYHTQFASILHRSDAALLVAPEEDDILAELNERILAAGCKLLGCLPHAVRLATDKWACHLILSRAELPSPETVRVTRDEAPEAANKLGYPLVVKPISSLDCQGVSLVSKRGQLDDALDLLAHRQELLLQRFQPGVHASVSLLASETGVKPLCLNRQSVTAGLPFVYEGGEAPLNHPLAEKAIQTAEQAIRLIPGLRGFVGVDMVLDRETSWIIEINPRLTTAYVGASRIIDINVVKAIAGACLDGVLPNNVNITGHIKYTKEGPLGQTA